MGRWVESPQGLKPLRMGAVYVRAEARTLLQGQKPRIPVGACGTSWSRARMRSGFRSGFGLNPSGFAPGLSSRRIPAQFGRGLESGAGRTAGFGAEFGGRIASSGCRELLRAGAHRAPLFLTGSGFPAGRLLMPQRDSLRRRRSAHSGTRCSAAAVAVGAPQFAGIELRTDFGRGSSRPGRRWRLAVALRCSSG